MLPPMEAMQQLGLPGATADGKPQVPILGGRFQVSFITGGMAGFRTQCEV